MSTTWWGHRGIEMSNDPGFLGRVRRLSLVSAVALGAIWGIETYSLEAHPLVGYSLLAGWVAMPTVLVGSLWRPQIRMLVIVPSTLVTLGLLGICATALPAEGPARLGWMLITGGVLFGAVLGAWFWYRWLPVPASLGDPSSSRRWTLIAIHIVLILSGLLLVLLGWLG